MGIIYLITVIAIIIAFMLIKKTDKTLNILSFLGITIVVLLTYNAFVCYVLTFVSIPNNLVTLSIVNIIISGVLYGIIWKKKETQKYSFDKFGLISIIIIFIRNNSCIIYELWISTKHKL